MNELKFPLTNVQIELLKLYNTGLSEQEVNELRQVLTIFYAGKAVFGANEIWDQKGLTNADMESWLNEKSQPVLAVIDTNVLLVSISDRSKFHWLYQLLIEQKIDIAFTNEILIEYEEQIASHWHPNVAANVIRSLIELPNAKWTTVYFNLNLISHDEDDNKFADCAFASNADYIVTNDRDFDTLKNLKFPFMKVVTIEAFKEIVIAQEIIS